jgi:hypothetical protein
MPPAAKSRESVKLPQPLHSELTLYALAAAAAGVSVLALAPSADAQIVYTPAHEMIGRNGRMSIDFNHDGVTDALIREIPCSAGTFFRANSLQAVPVPEGGGIHRNLFGGGAAAMPAGAKIGESGGFYSRAVVMVNWTVYGVYYFGNWTSPGLTAYLGIKFPLNGEDHYGWARMTTSYDGRYKGIIALLSGYAYETQPNTTILAGDEGENNSEASVPSQKISSSPQATSKATLGALALGAERLYLPRCPD